MADHERSLAKKYANQNVVFLGVNTDPDRSVGLKSKLNQPEYKRSFWAGTAGTGATVVQSYRVNMFPTAVVIDSQGRVRASVHPAELDEHLAALVREEAGK